jgi:hypothetical protein
MASNQRNGKVIFLTFSKEYQDWIDHVDQLVILEDLFFWQGLSAGRIVIRLV